jgi:hypothetical protein
LQTVYSLKDLYNLIEIAVVEAYNKRLMEKRAVEEKARQDRGL